jgi:hypothetical protein
MPTVVWKGKSALFTAGVNTTLVEQPESPNYKFGDRSTCTRTFKGLHSLCLSSAVGRGTIGTGSMSGWVVTSCEVKRESKQIGTLVIEYEATAAGGGGTGALTLPPDEFELVPFEINPRLEQHPNFSAITADERKNVRLAVDSQDDTKLAAAYALLTGDAVDLADQLRKGVETYYWAGWTYTWSTYSWDIPSSVSAGGVIETPAGPLASLIATNPGIDWLRQADTLNFDGTKYKLSSVWLGAAGGHFDPDLY